MEQGSLGCAEVLALLTDYLEEALPAGRRRVVARHLGGCPACSGWLAQLLATIAALSCLREGAISPPVLAALRESFGRRGGDDDEDGECPGAVRTGATGDGRAVRGGGGCGRRT